MSTRLAAACAPLWDNALTQELIGFFRRRLGCPDTAADLAQEAQLRLWQNAQHRTIDNPRAFAFRVASNLAIDHVRHRQIIERHQELALVDEDSLHPSAEEEVSSAQWQALLREAIAELPPRCRDAFILHKLHGLGYREVAEHLNISQSAVEKHISKGLSHCRARLGKHFPGPRE